jgi:EAL domain-containing protein (putative c-di-GMP-specific phosphodiesterase class I)
VVNNNFNEFYLVYQPQFNLNDLSLYGVECLLRWNSEKLGEISPGVFIHILENEHFIKEATLFVLSRSYDDLVPWFKFKISINLSFLFIPGSIDFWKEYQEQVIFEITESVEINEKKLIEMKKNNFIISLDDFGTGFNSLINLTLFPIDFLKIDMIFIKRIGKDYKSEIIIKAIIEICHSFNIKVVAEGVETEEQLVFLKKHHCDIVQGYLLSRPLTCGNLIEFIEQYEPNSTYL